LSLKLQDPLIALRDTAGLTQHLVLTSATLLPSSDVLLTGGKFHDWCERTTVFVIAVSGGKKKGPRKLKLAQMEEAMIENQRKLTLFGLGDSGRGGGGGDGES
jgi:hypothetical protein